MNPLIDHRFVNWQDGMLLTKEHLTANDWAIQSALYDITALNLNKYNYGLLPGADGISSGLKLNFQADILELTACRGVTPGGIRIEWQSNSEHPPISVSTNAYKNLLESDGYLYVVLKIKRFQFVEYGKINEADIDTTNRRPFLMIKPELSLKPFSGVLSDADSFPIFRLLKKDGSMHPDPTYIPPMVVVHGKTLKESYDTLSVLFRKILEHSSYILRRIKGMGGESYTDKMAYLYHVAEKVMIYAASNIDSYKVAEGLPPVYFINILTGLFRNIQYAFDSIPEDGQQHLLDYFLKYAGDRSNTYQYSISNKNNPRNYWNAVLGKMYNHNNSIDIIDTLNECMDYWETVFEKIRDIDEMNWTIY